MGRLVQLALALLLIGGALPLRAGEIIDRIVATVDGSAILASDWDVALRYQALLEGRQLDSLAAGDRDAALQRLIDQQLLREQMGKNSQSPAPAEVAERVRELRSRLPGAQTEAGWHDLLARYGLSDEDVAERVAAQLEITSFIDRRLRPGIHLRSGSVQGYYRDKLVPELKKSGVAAIPPLHEVAAQIHDILVEQQLNQELDSWLRSLRQQARIRTEPELVGPSSGQSAQGGWRIQPERVKTGRTGEAHAGPGR